MSPRVLAAPVALASPRARPRRWRLEAFVFGYLLLVGVVPLAAAALQLARRPLAESVAAVTAPAAISAIALSCKVGLVAALVNAPLGLLVAWILTREEFPGRRVADALVDVPLAMPAVVAGISFMSLYGPGSALGAAVTRAFAPGGLLAWTGAAAPALTSSFAGLVLANLFVTFPFAVRTVQPVIRELPPEVEQAAAVLGASPRQAFLRVVLPELLPAVAAGFGLAFARAVNEYGIAVLVSGNVAFETLVAPVYVYQRIEAYDYGGASAVAAVILAISLAALAATHRVQARSQRRAG